MSQPTTNPDPIAHVTAVDRVRFRAIIAAEDTNALEGFILTKRLKYHHVRQVAVACDVDLDELEELLARI